MKIFLLSLLAVCASHAADVHKATFPPPPEMTRAEVWFAPASQNPRAVLVLCPGMNSSGESLVRNPEWQRFASRNHLALAGISFASPSRELFADRGYTSPGSGSGAILLEAVKNEYGKDLPLLLYGFSSGAYFTEMMAEWKPGSILAWCAHATGRYENNPQPGPPGIVACGENDSARYGAAMMHFKKGRAAGNRLLWISLPDCGHQWPGELDGFVQSYFEAILHSRDTSAWVDIDKKTTIAPDEALRQPSLSGWLPSKSLLTSWQALHHP